MPNRNTEWFYFQGKGSWANRLSVPDMDYNGKPCWSIKLHFTDKSHKEFLKLKEDGPDYRGIMNEVKEDQDGPFHVFKRPVTKEWTDRSTGKKTTIQLQPPEIIDSEGKPWDGRGIGNGSDITVKVERYKHTIPFKKGAKGTAIRLVSVKVDNLIPYDRKDFTPEQEHAVKGLDEQPKQEFNW